MAVSIKLSDTQVVLPSASIFDFLPLVHALVTRLLSDPMDKGALQPKDLTATVMEIKQKLQTARLLAQGLPEIDRAIHDQNLEIAHLEAKIARQQIQLRGISNLLQCVTSD